MPSWFIDTLWTLAAGFILVVTGCFFLGMLERAVELTRERKLRELEVMSDEEVRDLFFFGDSTRGYPSDMVFDEHAKRLRRRMLRGNGMSNVAQSATFYADNVACWTVERG